VDQDFRLSLCARKAQCYRTKRQGHDDGKEIMEVAGDILLHCQVEVALWWPRWAQGDEDHACSSDVCNQAVESLVSAVGQ
jgi:hypothetical protein